MKQLLGVLCACAFSIVGFAREAEAAVNGYACNLEWAYPGGFSGLPSGLILFDLYSLPGCTGSFLGTGSVCGQGSTVYASDYCGTNTTNHPGVFQMTAIYNALANAASSNQKVSANLLRGWFGNASWLTISSSRY